MNESEPQPSQLSQGEKERNGMYHSSDITKFLFNRRARLPVVIEIEARLKKFSDKGGYFPKDKLKDILMDSKLIDEFERGWEKVPDSEFKDGSKDYLT